jgi:glutathione peroxidase
MRYAALLLCASFAAACSAAETTPRAQTEPQPTAQPAADSQPQPPPAAEPAEAAQSMDFYSLHTRSLEGEPVDLSHYRGKVALVVNVASQCGYTPQYTGLQTLQSKFEDEGFVVMGFPSNDFGGQEPGSAEEIRTFCSERYQVGFPLFEKVQTRAGAGQSPVYGLLGEQAGELPLWNFGKYLISRDGKVLAYFGSKVTPESGELRGAIEQALAQD